jgi:hypothetical protein
VISARFLLPSAVARPLALASAFAALLVATSALPQAAAPTEITHPSGERILLYPDGRWEYADPAKRAARPKPAASPPGAGGAPAAPGDPAATGNPTAATTPSPTAASAARSPAPAAAAPPSGASTQGGWLFGRRVPEGDPDFNRGSLNPKVR